jgi:hypothetical protein
MLPASQHTGTRCMIVASIDLCQWHLPDMICCMLSQVEAYFNEFLQLEESTLFQDSEVLESGNIDDWTAQVTGPVHKALCPPVTVLQSDQVTFWRV